MKIDEALRYVNTQIVRIERQNTDKELRPWTRDACPAASEWWGLVQQRIALSHANPQNHACCKNLKLILPERTPAQKEAAEASGRRLAEARAA
jgi:hypothetical protein